ncbi:LmbU family transcriptional regulator [Amycolatopsis suaedae]|uniref:LmbU family transcriptional regulator n=1 Tax=Amycolatopsis suaedae TaxID=2510978 RepID=UPI00196B6200|nr:LmbU family transcriptional regulator [Amycolatopsis suaedae]
MPPAPRSEARPLAKGALTRRTSLSLPPSIPMDEWSQIGRQIHAISDSSAWWLGDWLIYGQSQYPDRYKRAIEETSLDYQTLRNYAWVARQFPVTRRRSSLSFQHHAELASLSEEAQDEWLDRTEKFGWSRNELRNRVRASRKANRTAVERADRVLKVQMSVPSDRKQRWLDAASTTDQDLLTWIVSILDTAAASALGERAAQLIPNARMEVQQLTHSG